MIEEIIRQYLKHYFEPKVNDDFKIESDSDVSFRRHVPGCYVHNSKPSTLGEWLFNLNITCLYHIYITIQH